MGVEHLMPSEEQIITLRDLFFKKYEKETPADGFHAADIARVKTTDRWLQLFLEMYDLDMKKSLDMLWDTCIWRQKYGTNNIDESNVRIDYLKEGIVFAHNKDIDGKVLLIFKTKLHSKGTKDINELIRCVVYWIERVQRQTNMDQMTLFFDMQGTGLASMDMDFIKRIVDTFKQYYPNALNYIVVYEMAWILNAGFKIIKGILPPKAVAIMKFLNQKTVSQIVDNDNMLTSWGGKDDYQYSFVPAELTKNPLPPPPPLAADNGNNSLASGQVQASPSSALSSSSIPDTPTFFNSKKVHFANTSPIKSTAMSDVEDHLTPHDYEMLRITPSDVIIFNKSHNNENEMCGSVDITCTSKHPITYKIKTTSPEKFRVRPSCGALNPGATVSIGVILQHGHQLSMASKDKFLVMCSPIPAGLDHSSQVINEIWKNKIINSPEVQQHRLRCVSSSSLQNEMRNGQLLHGGNNGVDDMVDNRGGGGVINNASNLSQVSDQFKRLEQQLRFSQNLQWITLIAFLIASIAIIFTLKYEINQYQDQQNNAAADAICTRNSEL